MKAIKIGIIFVCFIFLPFIIFIYRKNDGMILAVTANADKGFHYGYYLYIPSKMYTSMKTYLLVEPNDTGSVSDDIKSHDKSAKQLVSTRKDLADKLGCILLVPTFIRPESNAMMYIHALDRDTILNHARNLARP